MLVITRDEDERILIGDDIVILVVKVIPPSGERAFGKVKLGIEAPKHVPIRREEGGEWVGKKESSVSRTVVCHGGSG